MDQDCLRQPLILIFILLLILREDWGRKYLCHFPFKMLPSWRTYNQLSYAEMGLVFNFHDSATKIQEYVLKVLAFLNLSVSACRCYFFNALNKNKRPNEDLLAFNSCSVICFSFRSWFNLVGTVYLHIETSMFSQYVTRTDDCWELKVILVDTSRYWSKNYFPLLPFFTCPSWLYFCPFCIYLLF